MATLVVSFPFNVDSGFGASTTGVLAGTLTGTSSATMTWDGTTQALKADRAVKGASGGSANWQISSGMTWQSLGVPAGATVTAVTSASLQSKCTLFTSGSSSTNVGSTSLSSPSSVFTQVSLSAGRASITGTDGSFVTTAGTDTTLSSPSASTDAINMQFSCNLQNTNVTGSHVTILLDNLTFTITYTPVPVRLAGKGRNANLIGHWPLNESSGVTAHDVSGNSYHGTFAGSTLPTWVTSDRFGKVLNVTPAGLGYVNCTNITNADFTANDSFSVAFWTKYHGCHFTAGQSGTTLTVSSISFGTILVGMQLTPSAGQVVTVTAIVTAGTTYTVTPTATVTAGTLYQGGYTQFNPVVSKFSNASPFTGWEVYMDLGSNPGGYGSFQIIDVAGNKALAVSPLLAQAQMNDLWHLIVGVCDRPNALVKFSIDGLPFTTASCSTVGSLANTQTVQIGYVNGQGALLHDVRLWKRAITQGEVSDLYNGQRQANPRTLRRNMLLWSGGGIPTTSVTADYSIPNSTRLGRSTDYYFPIRDMLSLVNDIDIPIIDRVTVQTDVSDPTMTKIAVPVSDATMPVIDRLTLVNDADMPIKDRLSLQTDVNDPVMTRIAVPVTDATIPTMSRAALTTDADMPVTDRLNLQTDADIPVIDRLSLQTDASDPVATRLAVTNDADMPVSDRLTVQNDADMPVIDHLNLQTDTSDPLMTKIAVPVTDTTMPAASRLGVAADADMPVSDRLNLQTDTSDPVATQASLASDVPMPMMDRLNLVNDAGLPAASYVVLLGDVVLPLLSKIAVSTDALLPILTALLIAPGATTTDASLPILTGLKLVQDSTLALMDRLAVITDTGAPLTSKIAVPSADAALPASSYSSIKTDFDFSMLTGLRLVSDTVVPIASSLKVTTDTTVPLTDRLTVLNDASLPADTYSSIKTDFDFAMLTGLRLVSDTNAPVSSSVNLIIDRAMPLLDRLALLTDASLPVSDLLRLFSDASMPIHDILQEVQRIIEQANAVDLASAIAHYLVVHVATANATDAPDADLIRLKVPLAGGIAMAALRHVLATRTNKTTASAIPRRRIVQSELPHEPQPGWGVNTGMSRAADFTPPIDATVESEFLLFDFGKVLAPGVFINTATVTCAVSRGTDANASHHLSGSPILVPSQATGAAASGVAQLVGGMVGGVVYLMQCVVHTSDGQSLSLWSRLACTTPS